MSGDVDVFGLVDHLDVVEPRALRLEDAARSVYGRRRARPVGVRDLIMSDRARAGDGRRSRWICSSRRAAGCSSTARSGSAATAARCSRPARRACSGSTATRSALALAREALAAFGDRVELVHADYRELDRVLDERGIEQVRGILADLGVSSMQLDADGRGFSFRRDEPLDMRMDQSRGPSVADLLRDVDETELADVIYRFGEERRRAGSRAPSSTRGASRRSTPRAGSPRSCGGPCRTTGTSGSIRRRARSRRCASGSTASSTGSTRSSAARRAVCWPNARLAVITFHSLEDRIVKHTFRAMEKAGERPANPDEASARPGGRGSGAQPAGAQRQAARD